MYLKPKCLSKNTLDDHTLRTDKSACFKTGPCGIGEKAIYLNSFYVDRCYYIPYTSVSRIYKRVAMSKGGFTGHGAFATLPYLVVEYDQGMQKQCNFKDEKDVDAALERIRKLHPQIPLLSEAGEAQLAEYEKLLRERDTFDAAPEEQILIDELDHAISYLQKKPELSDNLSYAAKRKRTYQHSNPAYRWAAMSITILGLIAVIYGIWTALHSGEFGIYFTLFGFAALFLFSGFSILPTAKNNRVYIYRMYDNALELMEDYLQGFTVPDDTTVDSQSFPVPPAYAHPIVLHRMQRVIGKHRAASIEDALELVKKDLQALNSDVTVDQAEYDEVVAVKPLFTVTDYA